MKTKFKVLITDACHKSQHAKKEALKKSVQK